MKAKIKIITIFVFSAIINAEAQNNFQLLLQEIESNNITLQAIRKQVEADKAGNRVGNYPVNPEVEFDYLWGSPKETGNRVDLNVTQTFDFPTVYYHRSKVVEKKDRQVDLFYKQQSQAILLQVRLKCIELIYANRLKNELNQRLNHANELFEGYQKMLEKGETNVLEYNKAKLNKLNAEKDIQSVEMEMMTSRSELEQLNGGKKISVQIESYPVYTLSPDFDEWFNSIKENIPLIQIASKDIELSKEEEKLRRALNLPKLSAGYMSERILGTTLQGVTIGVSIPLWENKNTIKYQKALTNSLQIQQEDVLMKSKNELRIQYGKSKNLFLLLRKYSELPNENNKDLLKKMLDSKQISLINYMLELSVYNGMIDEFLKIEKDYQLSVAQLAQWENSEN